MTDPVDDEQYFARVEQHFGRRRGGPLVLSPNDWRLLERWRTEKVPLRVVLRGINQAFDRYEASGPRPDRINSLRYCEQEVQAAWQEHRAARRRSDDAAPSSALPEASRHLGRVAAACRAAAAGFADDTAGLLTEVAEMLAALETSARDGSLAATEIDARAAAMEAELRRRLDRAEGSPTLDLPHFSPYEAS